MSRASPTAQSHPAPQLPRTNYRSKRGKNADTATMVAEVRARGIDTSNYANAEAIDPEKPLTTLQKNFVKLWAQGETISAAAHRAGYADGGTYAYRLVRQPNVLALYNEEKRLYEEAAGMSRKRVMDMLLEAYADAKMVNEPASMVSAAREIGRMCGYYEPVKHRLEVSVTGTIMHDRLNRLSDADLLKLMTEGDAIPLLEGQPEEQLD
jgi:hypothetical protein